MNALLTAAAAAGDRGLMGGVRERMRREGVGESAVTYVVLVSEAARRGDVGEAERLVGEMAERGVKMTVEVATSLMHAYANKVGAVG